MSCARGALLFVLLEIFRLRDIRGGEDVSTKRRRGALATEGKTHARAARPTGAPKSPSAQAASRTNALDAAPDARRARQPGTLLSQESHPQGLRSFPNLPAHLDATPDVRAHDGPPGPGPSAKRLSDAETRAAAEPFRRGSGARCERSRRSRSQRASMAHVFSSIHSSSRRPISFLRLAA